MVHIQDISMAQPFSSTTSVDIRKLQILEAMERLSDKVPFERLTVKMICKEADVSRQTFYNHFKDKFDIGQWFWRLSAELYLSETGKTLSWYEGNRGMLQMMIDYQRFTIYSFRKPEDYNSPTNYGYRQRILYLREVIEEYSGSVIDEELEFQIKFFVDAESRVVTTWVTTRMMESPEWISRCIEGCVPQRLRDLINAALEKNLAEAQAQMNK